MNTQGSQARGQNWTLGLCSYLSRAQITRVAYSLSIRQMATLSLTGTQVGLLGHNTPKWVAHHRCMSRLPSQSTHLASPLTVPVLQTRLWRYEAALVVTCLHLCARETNNLALQLGWVVLEWSQQLAE